MKAIIILFVCLLAVSPTAAVPNKWKRRHAEV